MKVISARKCNNQGMEIREIILFSLVFVVFLEAAFLKINFFI